MSVRERGVVLRNACHELSDVLFGPLIDRTADRFAAELNVPAHLIALVLAVEDKRFLVHPGIDGLAMLRALSARLVRNPQLEGASTITQQLYDAHRQLAGLNRPRTMGRKWRQALWAMLFTQKHSKRKTLADYLSIVYWGKSYYGLDAAAEGYFRESRASVTVAQSFFLAERLASPNVMDPIRVQTLIRRSCISRLVNAAALSELAEIYECPFGSGGLVCQHLENFPRKLAVPTYMF